MLRSVISGRQINVFKERGSEKLELLHYDPFIDKGTVYQEVKRIRSASFGNDFKQFPGYINGERKVYDNEPTVYIPKLKNKLI